VAQADPGSDQLVRRAFEAIHQREMDVILELFTEDAYFLPMTGTRVESGGYYGHAGIREYFEEMASVWEEMHPYANEVRDLGNSMVIVIGGCEVRGHRSGAGADTAMAWLQEIRAGRIASHRAFANSIEAYEAYEAVTGAVSD
jgi:ketosteroid isomerase-like protein